MPLNLDRIKAICFDIDGTLSETDDIYVEKVARLIAPMCRLFDHRDPQQIARRLIMGVESPGNWLYSLPDRIGVDDVIAVWLNRSAHRVRKASNFRLGVGIKEMLAALSRHYPLAIVSVRGESATHDFVESNLLGEYLKLIIHANTCHHTKPYPDPLIYAANQWKIQPGELLMVGDTTVDMECARRSGAQSVGVLSGFGEQAELLRAGADLILPVTVDLSQVFQSKIMVN